MRSGACCAPDVHGGTPPQAGGTPSRMTSPRAGQLRTSTSCAGAGPEPGPRCSPRYAVRPAPGPAAGPSPRLLWSTLPRKREVPPPASKHLRLPGRAASTAPRRLMASNLTSTSRAQACWSPPWSPRPTCRTELLPQTPQASQTGRTDHRPPLAGQGLHRHNRRRGSRQSRRQHRHRVRHQTRQRVPSPTATLGRRTHQRMDQPLSTTRPPLRSHPRSAPGLSGPQPNRPTTAATRPQPVVRHALGRGGKVQQ